MDKKEVALLLGVIKATWPNYYKDLGRDDLSNVVRAWHAVLNDLDFQISQAALHRYMSTERFPPVPADIRKAALANEITMLSGTEAWEQIQSAIRRFGYMREQEGMAALDAPVAEMAKRFGWQTLCRSEDGMADRAHFLRAWDVHIEREKISALLPDTLKIRIGDGGYSKGLEDSRERMRQLTKRAIEKMEGKG